MITLPRQLAEAIVRIQWDVNAHAPYESHGPNCPPCLLDMATADLGLDEQLFKLAAELGLEKE